MPKRYNNGLSDNQANELKNAIRRYNAKRERLIKKVDGIDEYLPEKLTLADVKKKINNNKDFNFQKKWIDKFNEKGSEQLIANRESGLIKTQYEINKVKEMVRIQNIKLAYKRKQFEKEKENAQNNFEYMGNVDKQNLKPKKFSTNKSEANWNKFKETLEKQVQSNYDKKALEQYKKNYMKSIRDNLTVNQKKLLKIVKGMNEKDLYEKTKNNQKLKIGFVYDEQTKDTIGEVMLEEFMKII